MCAHCRSLLSLTSIAGLAGLPQLVVPGATVSEPDGPSLDSAAYSGSSGSSKAGLPVGLGLIGPAWSDEALLDLAVQVFGTDRK